MALDESKGLIVRPLDPDAFRPLEARLVAGRQPGSTGAPDLSGPAEMWRARLREAAARRG